MLNDAVIRRLEDKFVCEIRVLTAIFGFRSDQQQAWADQQFPREYVGYYMRGWRTSRRMAWRRLNRFATELRQAAGDTEGEWQVRLEHLQLMAATDVDAIAPTTIAGHPDAGSHRRQGEAFRT